MKGEIISFLFVVLVFQAYTSPLRPLKRNPRKFSLTDDTSSILKKMFGGSKGSKGRLDPKNIKIPQYMLDLFSLVADKNGNRKENVPLDGSIVRSFFNEASSDQEMTFYFNLADIGKTEVIHKAELRLYQVKSHVFIRSSSGGYRHPFYLVEVREIGTNRFLGSKMLSSRGFGWHTIDLKDAVKNWVRKPGTNKGFKVIIKSPRQDTDAHKPGVQFVMKKNDNREAILVVYSDDKLSKKKPLNATVSNNSQQGNKVPRKRRARNVMESGCRRVDMMVDIEKINWHRWILQPKVFNAYRCLGQCGVYSSQQRKHQTNHATVQAILSETQSRSSRDVDSPCCAPKELDSMAMLLFEQVGGSFLLKLQTLDDIRVKSCACL